MKKEISKIEAVAIIVVVIMGFVVWGKYQIHVDNQKNIAAIEERRAVERKEAERKAAAERRAAQRKQREAERATGWIDKDNTSGASTMVRDLVRSQLVAPSTAKFPGMFTVAQQTNKIGDRKYRIRSYVDAQNRFGAMIRINYIMEFEQTGPDLHSGHWEITHFKALE